jgi:hypothetical protein
VTALPAPSLKFWERTCPLRTTSHSAPTACAPTLHCSPYVSAVSAHCIPAMYVSCCWLHVQTGPVQDDCFEGCLKNAGVYMVCMSGNGTAGTYTSTNVTLTVHPDPNAIITAITPNEVCMHASVDVSNTGFPQRVHSLSYLFFLQVAFASHKRVQFRLTGLIARGAMAGLSLTGDCHDVQQKALIGLGASYSATLHQVYTNLSNKPAEGTIGNHCLLHVIADGGICGLLQPRPGIPVRAATWRLRLCAARYDNRHTCGQYRVE